MIYFTGDIHGSTDIYKLNSSNFKEGLNLTKEDFVILLGDIGLVWYPVGHPKHKEDIYWQNWLENKNWTTLCVLGNHENYDLIKKLPTVNMFGGKVWKVNNSLYFFQTGEIYNINDKTFFVINGAYSIDKAYRQEGISWWKEEIPSRKEFNHGLDNLEKHNWVVDFVLGHTGPSSIIAKYIDEKKLDLFVEAERLDTVAKYFESLLDRVEFKKFYMGHFHDNHTVDNKFVILYDNIVPLGTNHDGSH
jgi:hypothetical protein